MDPSLPIMGIDDPEFANAIVGAETSLDVSVIGHGGDGDLDKQQDILRTWMRKTARPAREHALRHDRNVWLDQNVVRQLQRIFDSDNEAVGSRASKGSGERILDPFMRQSFRRDHDDLSPDQLNLLLLSENARFNQCDGYPQPRTSGEAANLRRRCNMQCS